MSSSLFKLRLFNGLLLDLDHNRVRDPITNTLVGTFTVKSFGAKLYDYADELLSGNGWFMKRPQLPQNLDPNAMLNNMQANGQQFMQSSQAQMNQFANNFPSQMQNAFAQMQNRIPQANVVP